MLLVMHKTYYKTYGKIISTYIYITSKLLYGINYCPLKGSRSKIEVSDLRFIKTHFMVERWRFKEKGVAGYWRFKSKVLHRSMDQRWWSKSKSEYAIFVQFLFFIVYCWRFKDWRFEACGCKVCWMLKVECWRLQDWQRTVPTWDGPRRSPSTVCESRYGTMDVQKCGIRKDQARSVILGFLKHDNSQKKQHMAFSEPLPVPTARPKNMELSSNFVGNT